MLLVLQFHSRNQGSWSLCIMQSVIVISIKGPCMDGSDFDVPFFPVMDFNQLGELQNGLMECLALKHLSEAWNVHNRWGWWTPGFSMIERVFGVMAHGNMEIKQIYHKWVVEIDWKRILTPKIWQGFILTRFLVSWNIYFPSIRDSVFAVYICF